MKYLVEKALDELGNSDEYNVQVYPGGGDAIKSVIIEPMVVSKQLKKVLVFLDGDQKKHANSFDFSAVTQGQRATINELSTEHIGRKLTLPEPSNDDKAKVEKKYELYKQAISIYDSLFFFGNTLIPEELLWKVSKLSTTKTVPLEPEKSYFKRLFLTWVAEKGKVSEDKLRADIILWEQSMLIDSLDIKHPLWTEFVEKVREATATKFADINIF